MLSEESMCVEFDLKQPLARPNTFLIKEPEMLHVVHQTSISDNGRRAGTFSGEMILHEEDAENTI